MQEVSRLGRRPDDCFLWSIKYLAPASRSLPLSNLASCQDACLEDPLCAHFTLAANDNNRCDLIHAAVGDPPIEYQTHHVSGPSICARDAFGLDPSHFAKQRTSLKLFVVPLQITRAATSTSDTSPAGSSWPWTTRPIHLPALLTWCWSSELYGLETK